MIENIGKKVSDEWYSYVKIFRRLIFLSKLKCKMSFSIQIMVEAMKTVGFFKGSCKKELCVHNTLPYDEKFIFKWESVLFWSLLLWWSTMIRGNLGKKIFISSYSCQVTRTEEELGHGGRMLTGSLLMACSACFPSQHRTACTGMALPRMDLVLSQRS